MTPEMESLIDEQSRRKNIIPRDGWERVSDWCIKRGDLRIMRLGDGSVQKWRPFPFELWNRKTGERLSRHRTAAEARDAA